MPAIRFGLPKLLAAPLMIAFGALLLPTSSVGQNDAEPPATATATEAASQNDMVFLAGEEVIASQSTSDDIFAAGSMVEAKGASADHLFLAGGEITVSDAQVRDVIAAGGDIRLNAANIADDVIIAGGEITARESFDIGGTAVLAGGRVRFEAPVGQDLRIGANDIFVNSVVGGNARLSGEKIALGPNARIQGNLLYRGDDLTVDPAAVIEGSRTQLPPLEGYNAEEFGAGIGAFFMVFSLSIIVSYFVIVAVLVLAVPGLMRNTSQMLQSTPLKALGIGVIYALVIPVLGIILLWTVLGIPLAILLLVASLALTPVAVAVTAHFIGMFARRLVTKKTEPPEKTIGRILWPLAGVVILFALTLIPFLGLLVLLFAMLFGLGAFIRQIAGSLSVYSSAPAASQPAAATA